MNTSQLDLNDFQSNPQTFQKVFNHFFPSLCYFAERLISDKQEAEDLVLDLFTKVWTDKASFKTIESFKGFLYISTRNRCLNFLKTRQNKALTEKELRYLSEDHTNATAIDFELINAEVMQFIYEEVERLPPHCRQIFKMIFSERLTTSEIASQLGIAPKTVLNQKLKAIHLLRTELLKKKLYLPLMVLYMMTGQFDA